MCAPTLNIKPRIARPVIPIARPSIGLEERQAVLAVLDSGQLAQGPRIAEFEKRFAEYIGRRHAVAVSNGTAALHLSLLAHRVGRGDEVVIPAVTFFACAATALLCGGKPTFTDIDPSGYTMDPNSAKKAVTKKTRVLMPVHLFGQTAEMDPLRELAEERDLVVLEDACQAAGAEYHGRKAGNLGDTGCFSFYPTKNMTTGEGGMVVTDDSAIADRVRLLRDHGQTAKYEHAIVGYNYRMTEVAAAVGLVQLTKLDSFVRRRRENASQLTRALKGIDGLTSPSEGNWMFHSYYQYVVRVERSFPMARDALVQALHDRGIGARASYPVPVYRQKALAKVRPKPRCRTAEDVLPRLLELPVHPLVSAADVAHECEALGEISKA